MDDYTELKSDLEEHCGRLGVLAVNAIEAQAAELERLRARVGELELAVQDARYRSMVEGRISYRGYSYGMGSQSGIDDLRKAIERDKNY